MTAVKNTLTEQRKQGSTKGCMQKTEAVLLQVLKPLKAEKKPTDSSLLLSPHIVLNNLSYCDTRGAKYIL